MLQFWFKNFFMALVMFSATTAQAAVDSYRFAHVTIATPWYIFLFLLMGVFVPFVLMAVLSWRFAMKKTDGEAADTKHSVK